jgi:glycosyltransferase involved in cell wall biosynthesis
MSKTIKIAVINSHPIIYFTELYKEINKHPKIEITAIFFSDGGFFDQGFNQKVQPERSLLAGYQTIFCGKDYRGKKQHNFFSLICPSVWRTIRDTDFDVVWFHGYNYAAYLIAFLASMYYGKVIFYRSETHEKLIRKSIRRKVRDFFLKILFRRVDGFLAIGTLNRRYYESLGVSPNDVALVPYTTNNERFGEVQPGAKSVLGGFVRSEIAGPNILYCAKFISRKHPETILRAMAHLQAVGIGCNLIMAGNGPILDEMKRLSECLNLNRVFFPGFISQKELPTLYNECDLFIHPSEDEPWGLVINEVMAAGLPVIIGEDMGCAPDLVLDGVNGYALSATDAEAVAAKIKLLLTDQGLMKKMGKASKEIIASWSYNQCVKGLCTMLKKKGFSV